MKDNHGCKKVRFVENETNMVVKPSSTMVVKKSLSEKFKHCLNSIESMSCWEQGGAPLPTKGVQKGMPNGLLMETNHGLRWRFVESNSCKECLKNSLLVLESHIG